ncbi:hypothetical protein FOT81_07485 [Raoultella planticola]|nr:hypothetical protein [Raoultella planticola]
MITGLPLVKIGFRNGQRRPYCTRVSDCYLSRKAVATGQTLKRAEFKWYKINDAGQEAEYFNMLLFSPFRSYPRRFPERCGDKYHFFLSTADGSAKVDISDGAIHLFTWLIRLHIGLKCG